jgi:hypothetical protein
MAEWKRPAKAPPEGWRANRHIVIDDEIKRRVGAKLWEQHLAAGGDPLPRRRRGR